MQTICNLKCAVLRKRVGESAPATATSFRHRILRCQGIELLACKLKHEIGREPMPIAFARFIVAKRGNAIDFCQVVIQHHSDAADLVDHSVNLLDCNGNSIFFTTGEEDYSNIPPMRSEIQRWDR